MGLWDKAGVPHKGWECVGMIDLGEDADDMDFDAKKDELYEKCEMCSQEGVRYIHLMQHPDYSDELRVGCICAAKMEDDYDSPRQRERNLKNRHMRKMNFLKKEWEHRSNGNYVLKYKGKYITIMHSKYNKNYLGVAYDGIFIWEYNQKKISDLRTAKLAAFDIYDDY